MLSANRKQTIALLLLSGAVAITFLLLLPARFQENESGDYLNFYAPVARSLLSGHGYRLADGSVMTRYPPGYPLLLCAIFMAAQVVHVNPEAANIAFGVVSMAMTSLFLFWTARDFWGPVSAWLTAVLWTTYPFALWLLKQPNSEVAFLPVLAGATFLFLRVARGNPRIRAHLIQAALVGILAGASMLIRPIAVGLPLVLAGLLIGATQFPLARRLRLGAALLCGALIVVAPWEVWLVSHAGGVLPLANNGPDSIAFGFTFPADKASEEPIPIPEDARSVALTVVNAPHGSLRAVSANIAAEARMRPFAVLKLAVIKTIRPWYATYSFRYQRVIAWIQLPYILCLLVAGWRTYLLGGRARDLAIAIFVITAYFWAVSTVGASLLRYSVPSIGLLMLLAPALTTRPAKLPA